MGEKTMRQKLILGIQHTLAMFGATVLVPALTGLNTSITLFCAGLGTLLFHWITKKRCPFSWDPASHLWRVLWPLSETPGWGIRILWTSWLL